MLVTLDPVYFVTLPLLSPAETDVLITARNTYGERFVEQVSRRRAFRSTCAGRRKCGRRS
jgi:hypothetical protein